ncbi:MAG: TauD/TfdA family dioxygenase [Rhodospirillaceae bacterium]|jgi:taurine dioxygenase|nr:TauD/TfdA family dioxygenase [Rhodospirillaceae bacterium]MBT4489364.1 TauD/TfdA family dioxygenase [Rhodospirillaceae bacterium]MBT4688492.1 TauD/TfdA family dioxygenase [Rhodospirillaceae bacterium]MBT5195250.1 TauD/TfdA family dioxygenase [Rhodospirillaceae bacterium]MBT5457461.1 TauD/TfdA family dioxygenase [Rhodospirillaceae bacterium]
MKIEHRPLPGPFGVEVVGLDMAKPLEPDEGLQLLRIFHQHKVIVLRDQKLDFQAFDRVTRMFGRQRPHFLDHLRLNGHPAILMLSNLFEDGRPLGVYEGAAFWHTDVAYEDPPNSATVVHALECPAAGCPTQFSDCVAAYDDLPQAMKDRIDDLVVVHHYGNRWDMDETSPTSAERLTPEQKQRVENVFMPLVRRHHVTDRPALYGMAGSSFGIVGWPEDEAIDLLDELAGHCISAKYCNQWDYAVGDLAAWDTFSTLHKAQVQKPAQGDRDRRLLWRVSVTGKPPIFEAM